MKVRAIGVVLGVLVGAWVLWFLTLLAFASEVGALPPKSRLPDVPAGATVVGQGEECGSGGCWLTVTLTPAAGQSPADLAREMGLTKELSRPPTLLDPAFVSVGAEPRGDRLVVHATYQ
ncbi:hypothetical protein ACWKSP_30940 [Micromonosporaceae bacterium Da 78-11]